jgi:phosphonate transport system substrate-binding protein
VIFTHVDSPIRTLEDLERKTIAFSEAESTTGFLLPAHMISQTGLRLRKKLSRIGRARLGEVNYIFTSHDKNTIYMMTKGRVDAAAVSLDSFLALRAARPGEYRIISSSFKLPRQVLLNRSSMDPTTLADLKAVLLAMPESEEGRRVLQKFENTSAFEDFPKGPNPLFERINHVLNDLEAVGIQ